MLFQEMLMPTFVAAAIDERIAFYRDMVNSLDCPHGSTDAVAHDFVCGYGTAVCRAAILYLESYRRGLPAADLPVEREPVPADRRPAAPAMDA